MSSNLRQRYSEDGERSVFSNSTRRYSDYSDSESDNESYRSNSTVPTDYGSIPSRPAMLASGRHDDRPKFTSTMQSQEPAQTNPSQSGASVNTYASTVPSFEDLQEMLSEYQAPVYQPEMYLSESLPATPRDFAELFPSTRKLAIAHDDSSADGNMNLRIDTQVKTSSSRCQNITLFHLRMHDLKKREFSFRRYERDSGREVCHTLRKHQTQPSQKRPGFQRSLSNALATLRTPSSKSVPTRSVLNRADSGYNSLHSDGREVSEPGPECADRPSTTHERFSTNTLKLEFSNYAQVQVKRCGARSNKRYEYEYWGRTYSWRLATHKTGSGKRTSYHLFAGGDQPLAHIEPEALSPGQIVEERARGGWVPPCSIRISDEGLCKMPKDISDVVVATGLIALVDDCIRRHFRPREAHRMSIPVSRFRMDMEHVGPKRLLQDAFGRPSTSGSTTSSRPGLIRQPTHG